MQTDRRKHRFLRRSSSIILVPLVTYLLILSACGEQTIYQPSLNLCEIRSLNDYSSAIYSDTLAWEGVSSVLYDDSEEGRKEVLSWYMPHIEKVIEQVRINCEDSLHQVYPFQEFDEVVYYNNTWEIFGTTLDSEEVSELLAIINNPLNFDWGETTFEIDQLIIFKRNGKEVARLNIMDEGIIKSEPKSVLMKFGAFTRPGIEVFHQFIDEI